MLHPFLPKGHFLDRYGRADSASRFNKKLFQKHKNFYIKNNYLLALSSRLLRILWKLSRIFSRTGLWRHNNLTSAESPEYFFSVGVIWCFENNSFEKKSIFWKNIHVQNSLYWWWNQILQCQKFYFTITKPKEKSTSKTWSVNRNGFRGGRGGASTFFAITCFFAIILKNYKRC